MTYTKYLAVGLAAAFIVRVLADTLFGLDAWRPGGSAGVIIMTFILVAPFCVIADLRHLWKERQRRRAEGLEAPWDREP